MGFYVLLYQFLTREKLMLWKIRYHVTLIIQCHKAVFYTIPAL